jgi:hypothetical protein
MIELCEFERFPQRRPVRFISKQMGRGTFLDPHRIRTGLHYSLNGGKSLEILIQHLPVAAITDAHEHHSLRQPGETVLCSETM